MKRIFSGVQPSGNLHIGNYIGALKQWVDLQNSGEDLELLFCVVDLHAITVPQEPKVLREKIREIAVIYLAAGIDPAKSKIFIQSENSDHPYLGWILNCYTPYGQLMRMTQFKEKAEKQAEGTTAGLFDYPVLMASDILLYDTDEVPVGEDQKQHLELARDLAEKFNTHYGEIFKVPEPVISTQTGRIMSLQDPTSKMSKSDTNQFATIGLLDDAEIVREKIKRAVTDSGSEIVFGEDKPAISNLLGIYSAVTAMSIPELEKKYASIGYGQFKADLGEAVINFLEPFQKKYYELMHNPALVDSILDEGLRFARTRSTEKVKQVQKAVGLGRVNNT